MKSICITFVASLLFVVHAALAAERLNLECDAVSFSAKPELNKPLLDGEVRFVGQTRAAFLDTDVYSLKVTTECEGKKDEKVCVQIVDNHYCPDPKPTFRIRSVSDDNDKIMIRDRCQPRWIKYKKIGETKNSVNFLEDQVYFQLKNQIYSGINIARKPILRVFPEKNNSEYALELVSFRRDLWQINEFDPLVGKLKVAVETYEQDNHDVYRLEGACSVYGT